MKALATAALILLFVGLIWWAIEPMTRGEPVRCPTTERPTGILRCWSGGALVYQEQTYRNGGVLCSARGSEIDIKRRGDLCVEESRQEDAWKPPIP